MAESCDECSPCWPHLGGFGRCPCDCHPADPATDLEYAMAVIEYLLAENERLREALKAAAKALDSAGDRAARPFVANQAWAAAEAAKAALSGSPKEADRG